MTDNHLIICEKTKTCILLRIKDWQNKRAVLIYRYQQKPFLPKTGKEPEEEQKRRGSEYLRKRGRTFGHRTQYLPVWAYPDGILQVWPNSSAFVRKRIWRSRESESPAKAEDEPSFQTAEQKETDHTTCRKADRIDLKKSKWMSTCAVRMDSCRKRGRVDCPTEK